MTPISFSLPTSSVRLQPPTPVGSSRREFLTLLPELPGEALLVIDNSSLEKIKRCHASAFYYLIQGREGVPRTAALVYGGAVHQGLERFHRHQYFLANNICTDEKCMVHGPTEQDNSVIRHFTNNPPPPDEFRTLPNALTVLSEYRKQCNPLLHPDYEWEILSDSEGPIIERAFELPLCVLEGEWTWNGETIHRIHLAWSGRIDLLASVNGRPRVVDNKTSSIDGDQFIQSFQLSSQTIGYVWASAQIWSDISPTSFCLNTLRLKRPGIGQSIVAKGVRGGEAPLKFFRSYFDYTPERVAQWKEDTILLIEDFLHSVSRNHWPMNDRHCFDKFGRCPYHDVCLIDDPRVRLNYLASDAFKPVTWNPTDH